MSEWIDWVSRLRRTIYARMEDVSFRTGTATVVGVLAVTATAILLTLIQGGHYTLVPRAAQAGAIPSLPVAAPTSAFPSATHSRTHRRAPHYADYVPVRKPTATPQAAPSPSDPAPRRTPWRYPSATARPTTSQPGYPGWPFPTSAPSQWGW